MSRLPLLGAFAILAGSARAEADPAPTVVPQTVTYSNGFILQSNWGLVRLYPRVSLDADFRGTAGAGAAALRGADGTPELSPRFVIRRGLVEVGGGALGFLDLDIGVDIDGRGTYGDLLLPGAHDLRVGLPNAWINAEAGPSLNLMIGVQPTPFSLEHRTDPDDLASLEPSLASQLAVPFARAVGATVWGTALHRQFGYDVMGITAVGAAVPGSFSEHGGAGRVFFRPHFVQRSHWDRLQFGISGRWTVRDGRSADLSREDLVTDNGFALWRRRFVDARGRTEDILPSGDQRALGFEAVTPIFEGFDVTGEVYLFADDTREAVEGLAAARTERAGSLRGAGWYAQASYLIDPIFKDKRHWSSHHEVPYRLRRSLDPGLYPHPTRRSAPGASSAIEALTDLQLTLRAGRVDATYRPTRSGSPDVVGTPDPRSPGGPIDVWELGGSASVWLTQIFRFTLAWQSYVAPHAGSEANRAVLPGQLDGAAGAWWLHEFTVRARMTL